MQQRWIQIGIYQRICKKVSHIFFLFIFYVYIHIFFDSEDIQEYVEQIYLAVNLKGPLKPKKASLLSQMASSVNYSNKALPKVRGVHPYFHWIFFFKYLFCVTDRVCTITRGKEPRGIMCQDRSDFVSAWCGSTSCYMCWSKW